MRRFFIFLILFTALSSEENFIVSDGSNIIFEMGSSLDLRTTPACSFNIAISLIGFETGVLIDELRPIRDFQEGYDSSLEVWKKMHCPLTWMKYSVVWYSRLTTAEIGLEKMQKYLNDFEYGNKDFSGGICKAWISSSLKISPREQLRFIEKMTAYQLTVSQRSVNMTRTLLFKDDFGDGWKLYGKTGLGSYLNEKGEKIKVGWLVGWIEKGESIFPFAYNLHEAEINDQRMARVINLFESKLGIK